MRRLVLPGLLLYALASSAYLAGLAFFPSPRPAADIDTDYFLYLTDASLQTAAERYLTGAPEQIVAARAEAEAIIKRDPLNSEAVELYAAIMQRLGEPARSEQLLALAVALSRHNSSAHADVALSSLLSANYPRAVQMIDVLFRGASGAGADPLVSLGFGLADFRHELARALSTNPPWREAFFARFIARNADFSVLDDFVEELEARGVRLLPSEDNHVLSRAVAAGDFAWAYRRWLQRGRAGAASDLPFNGNFAAEPDGSPFDWMLQTGPRIRFALPGQDGVADGLHIVLAQGRHQRALVRQLVPLSSGRWEISADVRTRGLAARLGFGLRGTCVQDAGKVVFQTEGATGDAEWTRLGVAFDVDAQTCPAVWLDLGILGRAPTDFDTQGEILVRQVRIAPAP